MDATTEAARIRSELKKQGFSSRMVSIRAEYYAGGSAIRVQIKDGTVNAKRVQRIAESAERIRRDSQGEILSGGNLYVTMSFSTEARETRREPFMLEVRKAAAELPTLEANQLAEIRPGIYLAGQDKNYRVHASNIGHGVFNAWSLEAVGDMVADIVEQQNNSKVVPINGR